MKMSIALGLAIAALTVPASAQYNNYGSGSNQNNHYVQPHTQSYPSAEGRLALRGEDLDRYRKSGSMIVSTC